MTASLYFVLGTVFVAIIAVAWAFMYAGTRGFERYREGFTESASTRLSELFLFIDARKVFLGHVAGVVVAPAVIYALTGNPVYTLAVGVGAIILPRFAFRWMAKRRLQEFEAALPDAIAQIAGSMRAGATLPIAIEAMVKETKGPISQEFSLVLRENRVGVPLEEAMENMSQRVPCPDLDLVLAAALIARDVGGNLSEIFERLASTLREKAAMEGKIRALTAQGKLQGWVVGLLPVGMILILYQMEPEAMHPLLNSVLGWAFVAVMAVLELMGLFMIKKIVTIDV